MACPRVLTDVRYYAALSVVVRRGDNKSHKRGKIYSNSPRHRSEADSKRSERYRLRVSLGGEAMGFILTYQISVLEHAPFPDVHKMMVVSHWS